MHQVSIIITNGKMLSFTARPDTASFFCATNALINSLSNANELVKLTLIYSNCVPILTYACSVKQYSSTDMSDCNVAVNNALRRVFGFKDWRSIRTLREIFHFKSIYEIFKTSRERFLKSCENHPNPVLKSITLLSY